MSVHRFEHFVTTWPRRATCHHCGRLVLDGIAEGHPYRVDPAPLTLAGELAARLAGRLTYWLLAGHVTLRFPEAIAAETLSTRPPVFAAHDCSPLDPTAISLEHITTTNRLIVDKSMETATQQQDADHDALLTIADVLAGRVTESPDDEEPPF
jgi:hypothetical protein